MKTWKSPAGELKLKRYPFAGEKSHQAWDAADEWIVSRFADAGADENLSIAVCGEAFGVLAAAWGRNRLTVISDSYLSLLAMRENRGLNPDFSGSELIVRTTAAAETEESPAPAGRLIIRLPKSLELLEIYIRTALEHCTDDTEIWIGGMDKRWSRGVAGITGKYLEAREVFPFERHARWIRYSLTPEASADGIQPPVAGPIWKTEKYPLSINPAPAVFSGSSLDAGTAAFLEVFPEDEAKRAAAIADMGCGSGILGLAAAFINPEAELIFSDESFLAVKAAEANAALNGIAPRARFITGNGLAGSAYGPGDTVDSQGSVAPGSIDLVLCNPPFHYKNIQTREPAEFMFREALRVLRPGGTVQIVGNSHLGYHKLIKDFFPDSRTVLKNSRFTVIRGRTAS